MKLRTTLRSPFARKIRVAAEVLGLAGQIEILDTNFRDPADPLRRENPLGKMPVLTLENGTRLFDSRVILEYLNELAQGDLIPNGPDRWDVLRLQALADGIMDAGVLITFESMMRPQESYHPDWVAYQKDKMDRGLQSIAADLPDPHRISAGTISLACALEWLDIRQQTDWRAAQPDLVGWLEAFCANLPAFAASRPPAL